MTDAKIKDRLSIDGSPSGKASDFDSDIRRFESYPVCQNTDNFCVKRFTIKIKGGITETSCKQDGEEMGCADGR